MISTSSPYAPNTEGLSYVPFDALSEYADRFDAKTTILNKGNFSIPGQGQQPDYCHKQFISHIHNEGSSALKMSVSCKLARCPDCSNLWVDNQVYHNAVKVESYARCTDSRPSRVIASMPADKVKHGLTLEGLRAFNRNSKDRILRDGVNAGLGMEHPFRIPKRVQDAIRAITADQSLTSGAFWDFIQSSEGIAKINDYLCTDFKSWRDCVKLSPHKHYLCFPGNQKVTGDKDIFIKKLSSVIDGKKVYTLDTVRDVVKHVRYVVGHTGGLSNAGKHRSQPISPFGELYNFNPLEHLTPQEYNDIKDSVLSILNEGRTTPLVEGATGDLIYKHEDQELKGMDDYIPMNEFIVRPTNTEGKKLKETMPVAHESINAWIASIDDPANMAYCEYLINGYSDKLKDPDIPTKCRRLFVEDLKDPPDSFKIYTLTSWNA